MNYIITIMVIVMITITIGLSLTHIGEEVKDTYTECKMCFEDGTETPFPCNCEQVVEYKPNPEKKAIVLLLPILTLIVAILNQLGLFDSKH